MNQRSYYYLKKVTKHCQKTTDPKTHDSEYIRQMTTIKNNTIIRNKQLTPNPTIRIYARKINSRAN